MNLAPAGEVVDTGAGLEGEGVGVVVGAEARGVAEAGEKEESLRVEAVVDVAADHDVEEDDVAVSVGSFVEQVAGEGGQPAGGVGAHELDGDGRVCDGAELRVEGFESWERGGGAALVDGLEEE